MKIVSLVSSYRKNGNTNRIMELVKKQLFSIAKERNVTLEIEDVQLAHADIQTCRGCRVCFNQGEEKCPLKDDLLSIREKISQSDGILASSPVYVEDVNGIMKNWIDRMAFLCHRPEFAGKSGYIITTSGIGSSDHVVKTIKTAFLTWGISFAEKSKFRTGELMGVEEMEAVHGRAIRKAAEVFFHAIQGEAAKKPSLYSLVAFKVQQSYWLKKSVLHDRYDYLYWERKGWLREGCHYFIPHGVGFLKVRFARLLGGIVAKFFA